MVSQRMAAGRIWETKSTSKHQTMFQFCQAAGLHLPGQTILWSEWRQFLTEQRLCGHPLRCWQMCLKLVITSSFVLALGPRLHEFCLLRVNDVPIIPLLDTLCLSYALPCLLSVFIPCLLPSLDMKVAQNLALSHARVCPEQAGWQLWPYSLSASLSWDP